MAGFDGVAFKGLTEADIVDNLTSTLTDKPLSAAQGKALNDKIETLQPIQLTLSTSISSKITITNGGIYICANVYSMNIIMKANDAISEGELQWGEASQGPQCDIAGIVLRKGNTSQAGVFQLTTSGNLWVNLSSAISTNQTIILAGSSFKS